jgi:aminopeptidase N
MAWPTATCWRCWHTTATPSTAGTPASAWRLGRLLAALRHDGPALLDGAFVHAMRELLRAPGLDPAFKELVLTLPSESHVAEQLDAADPQRIHTVREQMLDELAERLHDDWLWAWEQHAVREGYDPGVQQAGRRALRNLALAMLCRHAVRHRRTRGPAAPTSW